MKLHEYQSKDLLAKYGVPVAAGEVTSDPAEARAIAERLGGNVVVKAQVLMGGRGKAGVAGVGTVYSGCDRVRWYHNMDKRRDISRKSPLLGGSYEVLSCYAG